MSETQMKRGSTAAKAGTAGAAGVVLACAACCAPLIAPLLAWSGLSSLGIAMTGWYLEIAVGSAAVLAVFLLFRRYKTLHRPQSCQVDSTCGCGGNAGS